MKVSLILACAGKGERVGLGKNKLLVPSGGVTCLEKTLSAFVNNNLIDEYVITSSPADLEEIKGLVGDKMTVVVGGATRTQSVINALDKVSGDIVLIHDGARPFVCSRIINDCIKSAKEFGSGITAFPSRDTVLSAEDGIIENYLGKNGLFSVQTPQAFKTELIKKAYSLVGDKVFNDDGEVYKEFIGETRIVLGDAENVKITFPEDMALLQEEKYRFGVGFDCHKLVENRKLILGGVEIPHDKGLLGHSDADVLTHAIMDAILSSLSLRDIGYHFPDKDPQYKNADSIVLLHKVLDLVKEKRYKVASVSATIMAEKPKLLPHIPNITKNLSIHLSLTADKVGIGATTLEGLGFVGREEGICTHATATLIKI